MAQSIRPLGDYVDLMEPVSYTNLTLPTIPDV